ERLLSKRKSGKEIEYLIKWKGWPMSSCTWEPALHLSKELIKLYKKPPQLSEKEIASASNGFYLALAQILTSCLYPIIGRIYLDSRGQGKADDFPLKMKAYLGNSPKHFVVHAGKRLQAPKMPLEMVSLTMNTKACSEENLPT
ncbi:unnamed protein product, partial [Pocillopora meandrina]